MFCGINATASTLLACIDPCCHTWSSHHITVCPARDERNRDNPEHASAVTGSEAHRAAAAACTKFEKCDWHIFLKVLLDPNQAPFRPDGPRVITVCVIFAGKKG